MTPKLAAPENPPAAHFMMDQASQSVRDKDNMYGDNPSPFKQDSEFKSVWDHQGSSWHTEPVCEEPHPTLGCCAGEQTREEVSYSIAMQEVPGTRTCRSSQKRKIVSSCHPPLSTINSDTSSSITATTATKLAADSAPTKPKKKRRRRNRRVKGCNCKKSRCLKLYCECYAKQIFCGPDCNCKDCHNIDAPEFEEARANAVQSSLDRNTSAFFRAPTAVLAGLQRKGCKCKKSQCVKNYCECFQAGLGCMASCRCDNCQNEHGVKPKPDKRSRGSLFRPAAVPSPHQVQNIKPSPRSWPSSLSPQNVCPIMPAPERMSMVRPDLASRSWVKSEPQVEEPRNEQHPNSMPPPVQQYHREDNSQHGIDEAYEQFMQQQKLMARLQFLQKQQKALLTNKTDRPDTHSSLPITTTPAFDKSPNETESAFLMPPELPSADSYDQNSIMYHLSTTVASNEHKYETRALSDESSHCSDSETDVEGTRSSSSSATASPTAPTSLSANMAPELPSIMVQAF